MTILDRIDPESRAVLDALPEGLIDLSDIPAAREHLGAMVEARAAGAAPVAGVVTDALDPGTPGGPPVALRVHRPDAAPSPAPALYWIHGGGMVMGAAVYDDAHCAAMAAASGCVVIAAEYRLAPEHPFPAPLDDCFAGYLWLVEHAAALGLDAARIAVGGASAGGGLAAGLALRARARQAPAPVWQMLIYPMLDDRHATASSRAVNDTRIWNRAANALAWRAYLGGAGPVDPEAAPARAGDLSGLPPAYVAVGDCDMFLDEDVAYAQRLMRDGTPTELHVFPGMFHGSELFAPEAAVSRTFVAVRDAALKRVLTSSPLSVR